MIRNIKFYLFFLILFLIPRCVNVSEIISISVNFYNTNISFNYITSNIIINDEKEHLKHLNVKIIDTKGNTLQNIGFDDFSKDVFEIAFYNLDTDTYYNILVIADYAGFRGETIHQYAFKTKSFSVTNITVEKSIVNINEEARVKIDFNNPLYVDIVSVVINGVTYETCLDERTILELTLDIVFTDKPGKIDVVLEQVNLLYEDVASYYIPKDNNKVVMTYVFEKISISNVHVEGSLLNLDQDIVLKMQVKKPQNSTIESININEVVYDKTKFNIVDGEIAIRINTGTETGRKEFHIYEITYYNNGIIYTQEFLYKYSIYVAEDEVNYIYTADDLQNLDIHGVNILMADLDLTDYDFEPISFFYGLYHQQFRY